MGRRNEDGTYSKVPVDQPEDRCILLRDILESGTPWREKSYTIDGCYYKGTGASIDMKYQACRRAMVAEPVCIAQRGRLENGKWVQHYESREDGKTNVLTTVQKDNFVGDPVRIGCYPSPDGTLKNSQGMRLYSIDGKSVNMTALGGGLGAKSGLYAIPLDADPPYAIACEYDENGNPIKAVSCADGKEYPVFHVANGEITIKGNSYPIKMTDGYCIIRALTVTECMRLQTVPEWYDFSVISNSQAYKCLGNGWTCDVITHLINSTQTATRRKWLKDLLGDCL